MSVNGFDDLSKRLNELSKNVEELGNTESASLTEILTPEFIDQNTNFSTAEELFEASGFDVASQEAFEAIPENELDAFVESTTNFSSWREMLNAAGSLWAQRKLGL